MPADMRLHRCKAARFTRFWPINRIGEINTFHSPGSKVWCAAQPADSIRLSCFHPENLEITCDHWPSTRPSVCPVPSREMAARIVR